MAGSTQKDSWDKFEIIAKSVIAVIVTAVIGFGTVHISNQNRLELSKSQEETRVEQTRIQEDNRRAQTLIQMLNARESAATSLRTNMFKVLLENFLSEKDHESQVVMLEMIGLNFRDSIQIKPMFERLDRSLAKPSKGRAQSENRELLRRAARSIIRDQLEQIQRTEDGNYCELSLSLNKSGKPECFTDLEITLVSVQEDQIRVRTNTKNRRFADSSNGSAGADDKTDEFSVNYFDMPMVDYTHVNLAGAPVRYSVALLKTYHPKKTADIVVSILPTADYSADNRYVFDEAVRKILNPDINKSSVESSIDDGALSVSD